MNHNGPTTPAGNQILALHTAGMSPSAIGAQLGVSKGTVAGIIWRFRQMAPGQSPAPTRDPFPPQGHCLYPSQHDVADPAFSFCGEPSCGPEMSWCATHRSAVYYTKIVR